MSAIKDGRVKITLDRDRHMLFSLNVMDEVEDKIGDISDLAEKLNGPGRLKFIKWIFTRLLNEGAAEGEEHLTEEQVGKLIHGGNFNLVSEGIISSFSMANRGTTDPPEDMGDDEYDDPAAGGGDRVIGGDYDKEGNGTADEVE